MTANNLDATSGGTGSFQLNLNTLSENVYLDPVGHTVRQAGSMTYTPSASGIVMNQSQTVNGQAVTGTLTVHLAPTGGVLPFDSGTHQATYNNGVYYVPEFMTSLGSFSGSYSLVTGGQTYSGTFGYSLDAPYVPYGLYDRTTVSGDLSTISLTGASIPGGYYNPPQSPVISMTAANGFKLDLQLGWYYGPGNAPYVEGLNASIGNATGYLVPEPSSAALVMAGLGAFAAYRRRG
ncbi:MAG: PEP-CTERM sorting domain-containing protein [Verrucomicrobiota bacterium]